MTEFVRKVIHLPGTKLTPDVVLHRTISKLEHIKAVTVIIEWNDETLDFDWSQQKVSSLCYGAMGLLDEVQQVRRGEQPLK